MFKKSKISKFLAVVTLVTSVFPSVVMASNAPIVAETPNEAPVVMPLAGEKDPAKNISMLTVIDKAIPKQEENKEAMLGGTELTLTVGKKGSEKELHYIVSESEVSKTNGLKIYKLGTESDVVTEAGTKVNVDFTFVTKEKVTKDDGAWVEAKVGDEKVDKSALFKYVLKEEVVDKPVTEAEKAVAKSFVDKITIVAEKGKLFAKVPASPAGMKADIVFVNNEDKKQVSIGATEAEQLVELGKLAKKINYDANITVEKEDGTNVLNVQKQFQKDFEKSAPTVGYAYVIDGALVINLKSDVGLADIPLYWRYSYENTFRRISDDFGYGYTYSDNTATTTPDFGDLFGKVEYNKYQRLDPNDFRIPIEIPCKIQIVAVDALGNTTPVELSINEDNVILKGAGIGEAPEYVGKLIKSVTSGGNFEAVREKDLLVVQEDTVVNLYDAFKALLQKEWKTYNSRELVWDCDELANFDPLRIKFDRAGRYEFKVTKEDDNGSVVFTVLVMGDKNNVKTFKVIKDDVKVNGDKFKAIEGLEFKTTDGKEPNPIGFYAKYDGKYYRLVDEIPFATEKDKNATKAEVVIKDILNNKEYKVTFVKASATKIPLDVARNMFTDIKGHWAENKIVTLVANGVISGYPDKTFKPNNKISIRETLAIIGRHANNQDKDKIAAIVNDKVDFTKANWGNSEVEFVLKRLPMNIFEGKNLDAEIARDEVAYVMAHVFKYNQVSNAGQLTDVAGTRYADEIGKLVVAGTIQGYPDKTFKPNAPIVRAELCSMLFVVPGVQLEVYSNLATPATTTTTTTSTTEDITSKLKGLFE